MTDLPPRDTWRQRSIGIQRWRLQFDRIEVRETPGGKRLNLCIAGVEGEIDLPQADADHLAALLVKRS